MAGQHDGELPDQLRGYSEGALHFLVAAHNTTPELQRLLCMTLPPGTYTELLTEHVLDAARQITPAGRAIAACAHSHRERIDSLYPIDWAALHAGLEDYISGSAGNRDAAPKGGI